MPKKKIKETVEEQGERFKKEAQKLVDAGELNPTEADKVMEKFWADQPSPAKTDT